MKKRLFGFVCASILLFGALPALADPIAILDDLNAQDVTVARLDNDALDQQRAKADWFLKMTWPSDFVPAGAPLTDSFNYNLWYDVQMNGMSIGSLYYSEATAIRPGPNQNITTVDRFFVDPASNGSWRESAILDIDWLQQKVTIHNTERVMFIGLDPMQQWGRIATLPIVGQVDNLPMGGPQWRPTILRVM